MHKQLLKELLEHVKSGAIDIDNALEQLKTFPFTELGHSTIDTHRELRVGYPEIIYGAGKSTSQILDIVRVMIPRKNNILITRTSAQVYELVLDLYAEAQFYEAARIITIKQRDIPIPKSHIAIITAGTSDIPVAEEAAVTAEFLGNPVDRFFDVGVAGLHRLLDKITVIRSARVVIVIAGMEGALASVVGGLIDKPIIAVPTSVGYGANFQGLSALLGMLTSCASGVSVVNIDNGFGAAYMASMINKL